MDSVVHFEIPADKPERASKFYSEAFGWNFMKWDGPMPYWMVGTTETDQTTMAPKKPGAINGGMGKREGPLKSIVVTVSVADIDKALQKIEKAGGKTVAKKQAIGDMGFSAYFKDSEGNVVGLFQPAGRM
jgi:predicted enzyme related to lactoylglutathione lyase